MYSSMLQKWHLPDLVDIVVVGGESKLSLVRVLPVDEVLALGVDDHQVDDLIGLLRDVVLAGDEDPFVNFFL